MEDVKVSKIVPMNIIFPIRGDKVLLGIKTRKIGIGKFNGWGGKVESGETIYEAAARELLKESGLKAKPHDFKKIAEVYFYIHKEDKNVNLNYCDIFLVENFTGEPHDTEEMVNPTWFPIQGIPTSKMMIDADLWIPSTLNGNRLIWKIHLNHDRTKILGTISSERLNLI